MRKQVMVFAIGSILLLGGCQAQEKTKQTPIQRMHESDPLEVQRVSYGTSYTGMRVMGEKTVIRRGEEGSVAMVGRPNTAYTISSTYQIGNQVRSAYQTKTSDADGRVVWRWTVNTQTQPGTYMLFISGGGESIQSSYQVQ